MEKLVKLITDSRVLLNEYNNEWTKKYKAYADAIINGSFINDRKKFKERFPLTVYLPVGDAREEHPSYSIRYLGNFIGKLKYYDIAAKGGMVLTLDKSIPDLKLEKGQHSWTKVATVISNYYKEKYNNVISKTSEHNAESIIINVLRQTVKENKPLSGVQPVLLNGMPMQVPVPLKASTGTPKYIGNQSGQGHIDILIRNSKTRLSVIELKRPGKVKSKHKPIEQSIIYAAYLSILLREKTLCGNWWKLFGFKNVPPSEKTGLTINSVCMLSDENEYFRLLKNYGITKDNYNEKRVIEIEGTNDKINLGYIIYTIKNNKEINIQANFHK